MSVERLAFYFKWMLLRTWMAARPGRGKCFANSALSEFLEALSPGEVTLKKPSFPNRTCCLTGHAGLDFVCADLEGSLPGRAVPSS